MASLIHLERQLIFVFVHVFNYDTVLMSDVGMLRLFCALPLLCTDCGQVIEIHVMPLPISLTTW